ncbi:benzoate/H(+) symporter BenE family transporter [Rhodococcus opacus]|uniref:Benzoate/H(+) symporter BenE family transporter n=1 Tax=Rhodococcus opacus TaxID=37919 RepID=A0AAX3YK80_RHOOP|nr:benzoate/H(+) symporter BenE family transporter [Rhodococcus opacus]MCZ4587430.1 benzoate/H(+) symporter BenE family transporter [Rhodococcus opacus]WLF49180.1 benzoate/H(+) symporter BenE family transporter [Rhodococcus opacus]
MTTTEEPTRSEDVQTHPPRFERPPWPPVGPRRLIGDLGGTYAANGLIGLIFSATGPVAVILAAGSAGGLSPQQMASWIFGVFFLNGILTALASWLYRQPLAFFWTIPGTIIVGGSLTHLSWPEVLGAFLVTGLLILALGLTGRVRQVMAMLPMPIVMAMVAGVFLKFGTDLVHAVGTDAAVAVPMVVVFVVLASRAAFGRWMPPILGALLVGAAAVAVTGRFHPTGSSTSWIAAPMFQAPQFTWQAITELVVPLAITVIVVQNGQGAAVLTSAGHKPPMNVGTVLCGAWSLATSVVGAVSTCLTGPTNALLVVSGQRTRQYTAAVVCGLLAMVVGLFAPLFVQLMLATPVAFVATLGGLAMLRALQGSFVAAFSSRHTLGALVTFLVTVSNVQFLNVGAAFWGLLAGLLVSRVMESGDFRKG